MNYDDFKQTLQEEIQANVSEPINFIETVSTKVNETLDGIMLKLEGENVAPIIYPQKLYADYQAGVPVSMIAKSVAEIAAKTNDYPAIPQITPENAEKCISFSLISKERNQELLKTCPYKEVHDMAAVPRLHISDQASILFNNDLMQTLRMTKEEVLETAQRNTEVAEYTCKGMDDVMKEVMASEGMDEELMAELFPMAEPPFYIITNQNCTDGSCAILSDSFMQQTAEQIGNREIYLLPASRHEMIAVNPDVITDTAELKDLVMSVNSDSEVLRAEDFLSDSIYKYNADTHSISVCDSNGLFHDKSVEKDTNKPTINKGRNRI